MSGWLQGGARGKPRVSTGSVTSQGGGLSQEDLPSGAVPASGVMPRRDALFTWQPPVCVVGPPQIETWHRETMTADGNCLYYFICACFDVAAWRMLELRLKLERGNDFRQLFISYMRYNSKRVEAERLQLQGPSGYPGTDLLPSLSRFLGCNIQCVWEVRNSDGETYII